VYGTALNDAGQVLLRLYGENFGPYEGTYLWDHGRYVRLLAPEPGGVSEPLFLNDRGQAFGSSGPGDVTVWDSRGRPTVVPHPEGASGSHVRDANNIGQMVGFAYFPDGTARIALWSGGRTVLIPQMPGYSLVGFDPYINDLGQIAWTEGTVDGTDVWISRAWWFGRSVRLGRGVVRGIGDGGSIIGFDLTDVGRGMHWSVDWLAVFCRY